jgi:SWI/SNF-related matrix-associated actin-dependent regulator 1 of chromatin subfamily A
MSFSTFKSELFTIRYEQHPGITFILPDAHLASLFASIAVTWTSKKIEGVKARVAVITDDLAPICLKFVDELKPVLEHHLVSDSDKQYEWPTPQLDERLFDYQQTGVKWALQHRGGYIADEMGLGKTIQALQWLENTPYNRALIVAPASVAINWREEAKEWAKSWQPFFLHSMATIEKMNADEYPERTVFIATWAQVSRVGFMMSKLGAEALICDEAHKAKTYSSNRTIHVRALAKRTDSVLLLSGTPMTKCAADLYPQLSMITDEFGSFEDFTSRYSPPIEINGAVVYKQSKNMGELRGRVKPYMLFRKKETVATQLPPKRYRKLFLPIKSRMMVRWEELKEAIYNGTVEGSELISFRREIGAYKAKQAIDWIVDNANLDNPLVIFIVHKDTASVLEYNLNKAKVDHRFIVGSTPKAERQQNIQDFQDGKYPVIICSQAGQEGITLTRASQLLQLERFWNSTDEEQAEARVHRIGSKNPVIITYAHGENTIDELIVAKLASKSAAIKSIFQNEMAPSALLEAFLNVS